MSFRSFSDGLPKKCPPTPQPIKTEQKDEHYPSCIVQSYNIKVITPIIGGGAEAGVNDPVNIIRESSIRGHLRFWWRATRGAACKEILDLRQREGEIWGTTENPSPVQIEVTGLNTIAKRISQNYGFDIYGPETYVLFSAKQGRNDIIREGLQFILKIYWPTPERLQTLRDLENRKLRQSAKPMLPPIKDITPDIEVALWAWMNFGGIGARTRRGCGALFCDKMAPVAPDGLKKWIERRLNEYGHAWIHKQGQWSFLGKELLTGGICISNKETDGSMEAWRKVIALFRDFRQGVPYAREQKRGPIPGRTRWPEAESIRDIIASQRYKSIRPNGLLAKNPNIPTTYFPRAELGLPIIFEMKSDFLKHKGSPVKPTLQYSADHSRLASSFILRPLKFSDGSAVPIILQINRPQLKSAYLKQGTDDLRKDIAIEERQIRDSILCDFDRYPKSPLGNKKSSIDAFIDFAINEMKFMRIMP